MSGCEPTWTLGITALEGAADAPNTFYASATDRLWAERKERAMGRKIRRVPPHWEHPKVKQNGMEEGYQPMHDEDADSRFARWMQDFEEFKREELPELSKEDPKRYPLDEPYRAFCNWDGEPPDPKYYRPRFADGIATWYQVYETVSEGTPITPPFATQEELIEHLVKYGDGWDKPVSRKAAEAFVKMGSVPSLMMGPDIGMVSGIEIAGVLADRKEGSDQ